MKTHVHADNGAGNPGDTNVPRLTRFRFHRKDSSVELLGIHSTIDTII